ncbi:hypothetical protein OUZ56_001760 [Daphnia magna]|uniref:Uncharacterized protein n=1 Tax=Daphnia magna TaxID=35525 RepID=A0ABR0A3M8_9CRUS|nr:hypothetical protein OUZ56_001760 [Daphnia magna]
MASRIGSISVCEFRWALHNLEASLVIILIIKIRQLKIRVHSVCAWLPREEIAEQSHTASGLRQPIGSSLEQIVVWRLSFNLGCDLSTVG